MIIVAVACLFRSLWYRQVEHSLKPYPFHYPGISMLHEGVALSGLFVGLWGVWGLRVRWSSIPEDPNILSLWQ